MTPSDYNETEVHTYDDGGPETNFVKTAEYLIEYGKKEEAASLLKEKVAGMPQDWRPGRESDDWYERCFWNEEEFLAYVHSHEKTIGKSIKWVSEPSYSKAYYWIAYLAVERGEWAKAAGAVSKGLELEPDHPTLLCELAYISNHFMEHEEALEFYRRAADSRAWVPDKTRARALRVQGVALVGMNRLDEAEDALQRSISLDPDNELAAKELDYIDELRSHEREAPIFAEPRTVAFPDSHSVGTLFFYSPAAYPWEQPANYAQGHVTVPAWKSLGLKIDLDVSNDLSSLANLKPDDLQALDLSYSFVTDGSFDVLRGLTGLQWLELGGNLIGDGGLAGLERLDRLRTLLLTGTRITDKGLNHLGGLRSLKALNLAQTLITDEGIAPLQRLTALTTLSLTRTMINGQGLCLLYGLTDLKILHLAENGIGDAALEHLRYLPSLETLGLWETNVSDEGVTHLLSLVGLKRLYLAGTPITDRGLSILRRSLPECQVITVRSRDEQQQADPYRYRRMTEPLVLRAFENGGAEEAMKVMQGRNPHQHSK